MVIVVITYKNNHKLRWKFFHLIEFGNSIEILTDFDPERLFKEIPA